MRDLGVTITNEGRGRSTITVAGWAIGAAYKRGSYLQVGGLIYDEEDRRLFRIVDIPTDRCALIVERCGILRAWWVPLRLHVWIELRFAWVNWRYFWREIGRPQDDHNGTGPIWWAEPWT